MLYFVASVLDAERTPWRSRKTASPRAQHGKPAVATPDYHVPMHEDAAARLRVALELHDLGEQMMRQRLRRERPQISDAELEDAVGAWLRERPGAEHGDAAGSLSDRNR